MSIHTRFITLSVISCSAVGTVGQQAKKRIENAEQLPVHSYPVPVKASAGRGGGDRKQYRLEFQGLRRNAEER